MNNFNKNLVKMLTRAVHNRVFVVGERRTFVIKFMFFECWVEKQKRENNDEASFFFSPVMNTKCRARGGKYFLFVFTPLIYVLKVFQRNAVGSALFSPFVIYGQLKTFPLIFQ